MNTLENTKRTKALQAVKQTQWVGETTHDTLDKALTAINLFQGVNSGWYTPKAIRVAGLQGIYMINEDGCINFESRVIKISDNCYKIEHLTNEGYQAYENKYFEE